MEALVRRLCLLMAVIAIPMALAQEAPASGNPSYIITEVLDPATDPTCHDKMAFEIFLITDAEEKAEPGSQRRVLQRSFKLDEQAAQRFLEYIQDAIAKHQLHTAALVKEQCNSRGSIRTPEDLERAMSFIRDGIDRRKVELVRGAEQVLSQADKLVVDLCFSKMVGGMTNSRTDFVKFVNETGVRPETAMENLCAP